MCDCWARDPRRRRATPPARANGSRRTSESWPSRETLGGLPCPQGRRGHARPRQDGLHLDLPRARRRVAPFVLGAATEKAVEESRCYTVPRGDGGWWTGTFPRLQAHPRAPFDKKRVPASRQGLPDSMMWGALVSPDGKQHTDVMPLEASGQPSRGPSRLVRDRERLRRQRAQPVTEERVAAQARGAQGRQGQRPARQTRRPGPQGRQRSSGRGRRPRCALGPGGGVGRRWHWPAPPFSSRRPCSPDGRCKPEASAAFAGPCGSRRAARVRADGCRRRVS